VLPVLSAISFLVFLIFALKIHLMKYLSLAVISLFVLLFSFSSCSKNNPKKQANTDHATIVDYAKTHNLNGQFTDSGLYYVVTEAGSTDHPNLNSTVTVDYKGYFLDGSVFDQGTGVSFPLAGVIQGWQEGLQLIGTGGKITLIVPSGLAYGSTQNGSIPANSVLGFDITLHSFSK